MKKIKKDIIIKTDLTFEQLLKKALNTPLPEKVKPPVKTTDTPRKSSKKK